MAQGKKFVGQEAPGVNASGKAGQTLVELSRLIQDQVANNFGSSGADKSTVLSSELGSLSAKLIELIAKAVVVSPKLARTIILGLLLSPAGWAVQDHYSKYRQGEVRNSDESILQNYGKVNLGIDLVELAAKFIYYRAKRTNGKMSQEEEGFREMLVTKLVDYVYPTTIEVFRLKLASLHSEKPLDLPKGPEVFYAEMDRVISQELFRKYLGLEYDKKVLPDSLDVPTKSRNSQTNYVSISEEFVKRGLDTYFEEFSDLEKKPFIQILEKVKNGDATELYEHDWLLLPALYSLGEYRLEVMKDPKSGKTCLIYYDLWDIDKVPFVDVLNSPFEVYGRIDLDKLIGYIKLAGKSEKTYQFSKQ